MLPIIAIVAANLIWGAAAPIFKYSLQGIPPFTLAFIRFFCAGLIFLPFALRHHPALSRKDWRDVLLGALFGISINVGFFFMGLEYAPSINMHVIGAIGPVILYFLSLHYLKEKPHAQIINGMLISLAGVLIIIFAPLLMQPNAAASDKSIMQFVGNIFFFLAVLGNVIHTVLYKRVLKKVNVYIVTSYGFLFSALTFFPLMIYELQTWSFSQLEYKGYIGILYGIIFASALAYFCYNYAVSRMHAQEVGVFSYLTPIVAVIVAIPVVNEYPDIFFLFGSVLVFGGIYVSEHKMKKRPVHKVREEKS